MTASRSVATQVDIPEPRRRLDGRAWREIDRACKHGKKHDAYSVEIHGVRTVFRCGKWQPQEPTGATSPTTRASRQHTQPTSASTESTTQRMNSAQRRSWRRLQAHILKKDEEKQAASTLTTAKPAAAKPAQVKNNMRKDDAAMVIAEPAGRGQKRAAGESPALTPPVGACGECCSTG